MTVAQPTRSLTSQFRPLRYVPAIHTDVARTWRKFRLLARIQHAWRGHQVQAAPSSCPECNGWISSDGQHAAHRIECPHFLL